MKNTNKDLRLRNFIWTIFGILFLAGVGIALTTISDTSVITTGTVTTSGNSNLSNGAMYIDATSGRVGINTTTPNSTLEVNGYTILGSDAPKIKMKKIAGTTGTTPGNSTSITHGLELYKILEVNVLVNGSSGALVPPVYSGTVDATHYGMYINPTSVILENQGVQINNRPFTVLITYEE